MRGTPRIVGGGTSGGGGGDPTIGNPVIGADPNLFLYTDASGDLYQDALASRDSVTNETYIGYRTSGGDFSNAFHLGNILGGALSDGAAFQRHDAVNDNFTFIGTVDMTPFGGNTNALSGGYADLVNNVTSIITADEVGVNLTYNNAVLGIGSAFGTDTFYVRGELPTTGTPSGALLFVDFPNAVSTLGDYNEQMSHIKVVADVANKNAYVDGLAKTVVNWTPSTLSDGFTGTGLNDMNYDSTVTYTGTYPNTYTATIATVNSVYMQLTSITTPGFTVGDTVTDGASTGTIIAGSDGEGFIIIQPIVDTGWTSATSITDISSGAASTVGSVAYTDTMSWSSTAGGSGTLIPTSSFIDLGDGLTVKFTSPTGHTIGDSWTWEMTASYTYSKMALFDGANRTMSIGDVEQTANDVRTDWVLGTDKDTGIYEYLGKAREYQVYNDEGIILVLNYDSGNNFGLNFGIYNPHNGYSLLNGVSDSNAYGFGININDTSAHYTIIGDISGGGNNTILRVDDDTETITLAASHISAPLSAYADDADAGTNGVATGELYQTDGTGTAPLNIAGIVMIKQ